MSRVGRRVAVIGAGYGAGAHLRALAELGCAVVAVVTRDAGRAAAARSVFPDARICWPPAAALDSADGVDVAVVASPAATHLDVVREAATRGIDVVVDKPLDASLDRAEELVRVAGAAGIGLAVCLQHRAKPAGRALRSTVDDGLLGGFVGGSVTVPWWRPPSYYAEPGRGTFARDGGGVLMTQAIHALDLFLWAACAAAGAPQRVLAHAGRAVHRLEAEDTIAAVLDYGAGRLVPVHATVAAFPGREEELWLAGTAGTAMVRGGWLIRYATPDGQPDVVVADEPGIAGSITAGSTAASPSGMPTAWHKALLADAFDAFAGGREPLASGPSALVTQRVIAAAYRSAQRGAWAPVQGAAV